MEDQKNICRICLNVVQNKSFTYVDDENGYIQNVGSIRELIQFCIPELDMYVSTNPIVCHQCLPSMVTVYNFKNKCLHSESIIRNYIIRNNLQDYNFVNLNCVVMDEMKMKNNIVETKIKQYMLDPGEINERLMNESLKTNEEEMCMEQDAKEDGTETVNTRDESYNNQKPTEPAEEDSEPEFITDIKCEQAEVSDLKSDMTPGRIVIKIDKSKIDLDNIHSSAEAETEDQQDLSDTNSRPSSSAAHNDDISSTTTFLQPNTNLYNITSTSNPEAELVLPLRLYQCKPCNFVTTDIKNVSMHNNMYHSNGFLCTMCPFSTNQLELLSKHVISAHGFESNSEKPESHLLSCEQCTFRTNAHEVMTSHKLTHANNIVTLTSTQFSNLYDCPQCPYKTTGLFLLNKHIEAKHEKKLEFQCEHCSYCTKDKSNFRKHVFTHGTKPMQCMHCVYKCVSPYQMRRHVKKNHEKADLNNYKLSVDYFSKVNGNLNLTGKLSA